jgi:hypothetical protein
MTGGFSNFGDSTEGPYTNRNKAFEFSDNLSWIRGRHSLKFGGGIRYDMYNQVGNQFARGNFQFQPIATGYGFADYYLGYIQQSESAVALAVTQFRALSQSYYIADTWKVRSNMTVRSRPALRIHSAMVRRERHADERVDPVPRHDADRWRICPTIRCWCASAAATSTQARCSASRRTFKWRATAGSAIG